jgi:hypothetical protein
MTFKPAVWQPIAVLLSVLNLVAGGFAAASAEPWHVTVHATLALAFGLWAQRLSWAQRLGQVSAGGELEAGLEALQFELNQLRRELTETQERLDFVERLLAQGPDPHRVGPER